MTRTAEADVPDGKERTAAVLFAGFLALALGGAGVVIAALAVGVERAWRGGETERSRAAERSRGWLANQRAWLDVDHQQRMTRAKELQAWLQSGADPAAKPARPSKSKRAGTALRRLLAGIVVAAGDFAAGARDGAKAANEARRQGAGFRDVVVARPGPVCANCQRHGVPVVRDNMCGDCAAVLDEQPQAVAETCRNCRQPGPVGYDGTCGTCKEPTRPAATPAGPAAGNEAFTTTTTPARSAEDRQLPPTTAVISPQQPTTQGVTVTETAATASPTPATESNATVLRGKLLNTKTTLSRIAELTDQLAKERATLDGQVRDATEFAQVTGQSSQARQALDESGAVSTAMGDRLGEFSQNAISAEEQMVQAADGLRVAENAEDQLRTAGADGRAVAPAGAAA